MNRILFALALVLSALPLSVARAQLAPDPAEEAREAAEPYRRGFAVEPYHNGNSLGPMLRPRGKLARVVWLQGGGFGSELPGDPPGWERRVVQLFDDEGRCAEIEDWSMGGLESRRMLLFRPDGRIEALIHSNGRTEDAPWRSTPVRDEAGKILAFTRIRLDSSGKPSPSAYPAPECEITYDAEGRPFRQIDYDEAHDRSRLQTWTYDPEGRVKALGLTSYASGVSTTKSYDYDEEGRVRVETADDSNGPPAVRTEYEYDGPSLRVRHVRLLRGDQPLWEVSYGYDAEGKLARRSMDDHRSGRHTVETYQGGEDRLLAREIKEKGRLVEATTFEYVEDERGNWVRRITVRKGFRENDTMRVIEYAD